MKTNALDTYEEWLSAIANTRLLFNTMEELEEWLDNHSIHNNGVKRSFKSEQRMRAAFRDLKEQVRQETDEVIDLERLLDEYEEAWDFYTSFLARRTNPEVLALQLLQYRYAPTPPADINRRTADIFEQAKQHGISVHFLIAFMMKAIPGYVSRDGDATDMPQKYEAVMLLLEQFTSNTPAFVMLPALEQARLEENKTRLMLIYHMDMVLETYYDIMHPQELYELSNIRKQQMVSINLEGFWNECDGRNEHTHFWQFEETVNNTGFFMHHWEKCADGTMRHTRYSMLLCISDQGKRVAFMTHPLAIAHHLQGLPYTDKDHAYYFWKKNRGHHPSKFSLVRHLSSNEWPASYNFTRVTDESLIAQYEYWQSHSKSVEEPYSAAEFFFLPNLYAVSQNHLYILSLEEDFLYRIPRNAREGFDKIKLSDNVGVLIMNDKAYLVFDELDFYIPITPESLEKYGITKVEPWEQDES